MATPQYVTQHEAAELTGLSYDTIRGDRKKGKLPNSRSRADGTVEVSVADLVACGRLDPLAVGGDLGDTLGRSRLERDLVTARHELDVARTRLEHLQDQLTHQRDEIAHLRRTVSDLTKAAA